jgi:hypothetical protein
VSTIGRLKVTSINERPQMPRSSTKLHMLNCEYCWPTPAKSLDLHVPLRAELKA